MKVCDKNKRPGKIKYTTVFLLFFFGSIAGFILEGIWRIITLGHWENHSATVWGPFCIIYGIGAAVMYITACFLNKKPLYLQYILYCFIGAAVEYVGSAVQEIIFGSRSWDYSADLLNLNGRISLLMTLIWGLLGTVFIKVFFPFIVKSQEKLDEQGEHIKRLNRALCTSMTVFMIINLLVTSAAILRWSKRLEGEPPKNKIEISIDRYFDNEKMSEIFNNMTFVPKDK